jgi:hypothetical protein
MSFALREFLDTYEWCTSINTNFNTNFSTVYSTKISITYIFGFYVSGL